MEKVEGECGDLPLATSAINTFSFRSIDNRFSEFGTIRNYKLCETTVAPVICNSCDVAF